MENERNKQVELSGESTSATYTKNGVGALNQFLAQNKNRQYANKLFLYYIRKAKIKVKEQFGLNKPTKAYTIFLNEGIPSLHSEYPNLDQRDIITTLSERWNKLSEEDKLVYYEKETAEKANYAGKINEISERMSTGELDPYITTLLPEDVRNQIKLENIKQNGRKDDITPQKRRRPTTSNPKGMQAPKREVPRAFCFFMYDKMRTLRCKYPDLTQKDCFRVLEEIWSKMSTGEKGVYIKQAEIARGKSKWRGKGGDLEPGGNHSEDQSTDEHP